MDKEQVALLSNFEQNKLVNDIAGNRESGGWPALDAQIKLIEEEFNELKEAIEKRDLTKVRDGIADVLVTTYGAAHRAGIDANADHLAVTMSNLSKFDLTLQDASKTHEKYKELGIETNLLQQQIGYDTYYVTVSAKNQADTNGKFYPSGKFLKSINFKEPIFEAVSAGNKCKHQWFEEIVRSHPPMDIFQDEHLTMWSDDDMPETTAWATIVFSCMSESSNDFQYVTRSSTYSFKDDGSFETTAQLAGEIVKRFHEAFVKTYSAYAKQFCILNIDILDTATVQVKKYAIITTTGCIDVYPVKEMKLPHTTDKFSLSKETTG